MRRVVALKGHRSKTLPSPSTPGSAQLALPGRCDLPWARLGPGISGCSRSRATANTRLADLHSSQARMARSTFWIGVLAACVPVLAACSTAADTTADSAADVSVGGADVGAVVEEACRIPAGDVPDYTVAMGCQADFDVLAARPLDASIPGAVSVKVLVDRADGDALYYINTNAHPRHFDFATDFLSAEPLPPVLDIALFNQTEYRSPDRRFVLGAVTYYDAAAIWAFELAPYDSASPAMIETALTAIVDSSWFGPALRFHPTSEGQAAAAADLPPGIPIVTTDEIFAGTSYQPLKLGESYGQLRFFNAAQLAQSYVGPRDIVVLETVPNDLAVVAGVITAEPQTPLSHVNVLAQNRGTPNMALRGAFQNPDLVALADQWVRLWVGAFDYTVEASTREAADAWWDANKPPAVQVPALDLSVTELTDIEELSPDSMPAFGGKAANYGLLARLGADVPVPRAFAVPVHYYKAFEAAHGFDAQVAALRADARFVDDAAYRETALANLRKAMETAPLDEAFLTALLAKLDAEYPGTRMRFRSSTNAEDLATFTGAGLYSSNSGQPGDPKRPVADAVRQTWASLWNFRAYEEREYNGIPHDAVAMALLVHRSFPNEEANGVALTNNPFDASQPAFYVNVQLGEFSVVAPDPGTTVDAFLYFYAFPGQPATYLSRSSLTLGGAPVLDATQLSDLGRALDAIHRGFAARYEVAGRFYAMDVEFKVDDLDSAGPPTLWIKQARPHPGFGEQ